MASTSAHCCTWCTSHMEGHIAGKTSALDIKIIQKGADGKDMSIRNGKGLS